MTCCVGTKREGDWTITKEEICKRGCETAGKICEVSGSMVKPVGVEQRGMEKEMEVFEVGKWT